MTSSPHNIKPRPSPLAHSVVSTLREWELQAQAATNKNLQQHTIAKMYMLPVPQSASSRTTPPPSRRARPPLPSAIPPVRPLDTRRVLRLQPQRSLVCTPVKRRPRPDLDESSALAARLEDLPYDADSEDEECIVAAHPRAARRCTRRKRSCPSDDGAQSRLVVLDGGASPTESQAELDEGIDSVGLNVDSNSSYAKSCEELSTQVHTARRRKLEPSARPQMVLVRFN